jgi:hypothetical protein
MKRLNIVYSFVALIGLYGCSADLPIPTSDLPEFKQKLVVNSSVDNLNPISIKISNSAGAYTENLPQNYRQVKVSLRKANSSFDIPLVYDQFEEAFVASAPATPGVTYDLLVTDTVNGMPAVNARCVLPEQVLNKQIGYVENGGIDMEGLTSDLLTLKWTDVAGANYYIVHFYYYSETANLFIPFDFELNDPTLSDPKTVKLSSGGYLFDDGLFNGQEKTLNVVPPGGLVAGNTGPKYLIELRSVTDDYYRYHTTLQQYKDQDGVQQTGPFGSAIIVHSNINNGLGAFISSTLESDTIR